MATSKEYELLNPETKNLVCHHQKQYPAAEYFQLLENHFAEEMDIRKVALVAHLSVPSFCNYF